MQHIPFNTETALNVNKELFLFILSGCCLKKTYYRYVRMFASIQKNLHESLLNVLITSVLYHD